MKLLYKYRKVLLIVLAVILIIIAFPWLRQLSVEEIVNFTPRSPILAALVLIGFYCAKPVLMVIPSYALYIASGILFPTGWAILINYIGLTIQLTLGFYLGRWLGRERVTALVSKSPRAAKVIGYIDSNSQLVCFATRLLPMPYPVDLGSMFFAASGMHYWRHLGFSLLGLTPVMIPFTMAGSAISNPLSAEFLVPFAISISLSVGLFAVYQMWLKRQAKANPASEDKPSADDSAPHPPA